MSSQTFMNRVWKGSKLYQICSDSGCCLELGFNTNRTILLTFHPTQNSTFWVTTDLQNLSLQLLVFFGEKFQPFLKNITRCHLSYICISSFLTQSSSQIIQNRFACQNSQRIVLALLHYNINREPGELPLKHQI